MSKNDEIKQENWLEAYHDPIAGLYAFSSCLSLADLNGDGDNKLLLATLGTGTYSMKLKVYKGTSVIQENSLLDLPMGISTFYMDLHEPRTPGIAVASGPYLYVYKNMRPYYKYTLPLLPINPLEGDIWNQARDDKVDMHTLSETLYAIKSDPDGLPLSSRSLQFLQLDSTEEQEKFAASHKSLPLKRQTVITCLTTMKKSVPEDDAISCVVVTTENREAYILDSEAFSILQQNILPDIASFINVSGLFDVDFRLFAACRNGKVYILKKGSDSSYLCLESHSQIVGMERIHKHLIVACMDNTLTCYSSKGKKLWRNYLQANILCTAIMDHKSKGFKAVLVGLDNCQIQVYREKYLVDTIMLRESPTAFVFGKYGREESTLITVTSSGALSLLIMKRTAEYATKDSQRGPPVAQSIKLNIPKKTQLFVDQTVRERENGPEMFRAFQQDLQRLRLSTARTYLKALDSSMTPISSDPEVPLKISATVQGLGPIFKLVITMQNTASDYTSSDPKIATGLMLCFKYSDMTYNVDPELLFVPALVPGVSYKLETRVECIVSDRPAQEDISAVVIKKDRTRPIVTANISMPASEAVIVV